MAQRLIQNNFVAGELAPDLYGRVDIRQYFQAAAEIENFIPKKTGGVRKRAGTAHVDMAAIANCDSAVFRVFPVFKSRTEWALILAYRKNNSNTFFYRTMLKGHALSGEMSTSVTQLGSDADLRALKVRQIGDTLFFARRGARSFRAKLDYTTTTPSVQWNLINDRVTSQKPAKPSVTMEWPEEGKDPDKGYMPTTRKYGLFGVKSGIYSPPAEVEVDVYLPWIGGAYVLLEFQPDFSKHDFYVLALQQGADWGVLATYFPNSDAGSATDVNAWSQIDSSSPVTATIGNTLYRNGGGSVNGSLRSLKPNETAKDGNHLYHKNALFCVYGGAFAATYKSATAPITAVKIWFGARLRIWNGSAATGAADVGTAGSVTVTLKCGTTTIATWQTSGLYSSSYTTLEVENPTVTNSANYTVEFTSTDGDSTAVVVRGIVLVSDVGKRSYKDQYYSAGSVCGIQERLTVGDGGMDCGVVDVWQQRLMYASSNNLPFTMWFSRVNDLYNFYADRPQTADDAFSATIPAIRASRILHSLSGQWLMLFTEGGEYEVTGGGSSGFSFATINIRKTSNIGAHDKIEPVVAEQKALFVAADGRTVYDLAYSLEQDNIIPRNRSVFAPHLTETAKIVKLAYQRYPDSVVWCLLDDGTLLSFTYLPEQDVYAWARHSLAGGAGLKCVDINAPDTVTDESGYEVTSDILLTLTSEADPTKVWIERMRQPTASDTPSSSAARCTDHWGYPQADWPSGGNPEAHIRARLVTLRPEEPNNNTMGYLKNIFDCVLRVRRSGTITVRPHAAPGTVAATSTDLFESGSPVESDDTVALVNGDVKVLPYAYHNDTGQMEIESADKWPCEILSLGYVIDVGVPPAERR